MPIPPNYSHFYLLFISFLLILSKKSVFPLLCEKKVFTLHTNCAGILYLHDYLSKKLK